jgi:hypothetical protein
MYSAPYIIFGSCSYRFKEENDPRLQTFESLNAAPKDLLPSLTVHAVHPEPVLNWLEKNDASLITDLYIFPLTLAPDDRGAGQRWCRLFDKLSREAPNIQSLEVFWDAVGPWGTRPPWEWEDPLNYGMGRSVEFIRGLATLKVRKSVQLRGFYALHWPAYLQEKIGLKPLVEAHAPGSYNARALTDYQIDTRGLNPWTQTQDERSPLDINLDPGTLPALQF